jgi:hypothetical protein
MGIFCYCKKCSRDLIIVFSVWLHIKKCCIIISAFTTLNEADKTTYKNKIDNIYVEQCIRKKIEEKDYSFVEVKEKLKSCFFRNLLKISNLIIET